LRQLCNLAYVTLAEGRDRTQLAELDALLAPPEDKERARDKMNQQAMTSLGGFALGPPPVKAG
jgi:hypothetical protein